MISTRLMKAWEKFDNDIEQFAIETEESKYAEVTLYEDAFTTRHVQGFNMTEEGELTWLEDGKLEVEQMIDEDDAREWLKFWRANLRRAKRYWAMDVETLGKIQDGQIEDMED